MESAKKKSKMNQSDPSLLENLLPELKDLLFSYLPVEDLKNLRLSSSRLSHDVISIEKRFRVLTLTSSDDLPQVLHSKAVTVCVNDMNFYGDMTKLSDWLKLNSSSISGVKMSLDGNYEELFEFLESTTDTLENLHIFSSGMIKLPIPKHSFSKLEYLYLFVLRTRNLTQFLAKCTDTVTHFAISQNLWVQNFMKVKFTALESVEFIECVKLSQMKEFICKSSQDLKEMKLTSCRLLIDSDLDIELPSLSQLTLDDERDYGWTLNYMKTLTKLCLVGCTYDWLDQLDHNLPGLKILKLTDTSTNLSWTTEGLNALLNKCPNLRTLVLECNEVNFDTKMPHLKNLYMLGGGKDIATMVNSCRSSLEVLAVTLTQCDISVLHNVDGRLGNLKKLYICTQKESLSEKDQTWLQENLLPKDAQVYTCSFDDMWNLGQKLFKVEV